jgi:flagellar biogenesis protein FliO
MILAVSEPQQILNTNLVGTDWMGSMAMLVGLVVGLYLLTRWIRKGKPLLRGQSAHLQVLERRRLSNKTTLYLISIRGKGLVVAESSHGVQRIGEVELDQVDQPAQAASLASQTDPSI